MNDTNTGLTQLQAAKAEVSEFRQRVLKQQGVVLSLRRAAGRELDEAVALLNSMKDELEINEARLESLIMKS